METNARYYPKDVIENWIKDIKPENVIYQYSNSSWDVIKDNNVIIGFAQYDVKDGELYQLQVDPDYQSKGHGKKLYEHIEKEFIRNKKDKITLNSTLNAKGFYISVGFKPLEKILYKGTEEISMEKVLGK